MTSRVPQRADAQRNRERLLAAAETAFNAQGADASLDDIAKAAGVGNATLYRHFPTRAELLEAVYNQRIADLCAAAAELTQPAAPDRALHEWLRAIVAHVTDRRVLTDAFLAAYEGPAGTEPPQFTAWHNALFDAGRPLLAAAQDAGTARRDLDIAELLALVTGVARAGSPGQAERFLSVLLDGITPRLPYFDERATGLARSSELTAREAFHERRSGQHRFVELIRECLTGQAVRAEMNRAKCQPDGFSASSRRPVIATAPGAAIGGKGGHQSRERQGDAAHAAEPLGALLTVRSQSRHRPVISGEQQLGKLPHVAQRQRQALAIDRIVVSPSVAEQHDPVRVGFIAPGLLTAERRARPGCRAVAQASFRRDRPQPGECLKEPLRPRAPGPSGRLLVRVAGVQAHPAAALREDIELKVS